MRFIDSIEPAGEAEACASRSRPQDSLYVTEDFLLTHNTLNDAFIILDEAQNTLAEQMKMFLTRLGFGSKMVVTGDVTQVDLPGGTHSGLRVVQEILDGIEDVHFCRLTSRTSYGTGWSARSSTRTSRWDADREPAAGRSAAGAATPTRRRAGTRDEHRGQQRVRRTTSTRSGSVALARFVLDRMRVHPQAELSVLLVDVDAMTDLHVQWMDEPGPTDVLSFPMDELRPGADDEDPGAGAARRRRALPRGRRRSRRATAGHSHRRRARPAHHARHPAPARLRPRRAGRGEARCSACSAGCC